MHITDQPKNNKTPEEKAKIAQKQSVSIKNRKASHDFKFEKEYEAGIKLLGSEVKSIRNGDATISDAYCFVSNGILLVKNMFIADLKNAVETHVPLRDRALLLNKKEIEEIHSYVSQKGYTLVVEKIYNKRGLIKLKLQLAKGKKDYDKRQDLKKKDIEREMKREGF